jgi:hypothetical protein
VASPIFGHIHHITATSTEKGMSYTIFVSSMTNTSLQDFTSRNIQGRLVGFTSIWCQ